jgi:hypothetical protein
MFPRTFFSVVALVGVVFFASETRADPISELKSFSIFDSVDLSELKGEAKVLRGPAMSTPRFQSVQSVWIQPGAPDKVNAAIRSFNPARHSDLRVLIHSNGTNFSQLNNAPNNGAVQWLVNATVTKSTELQISREEAAKLPSSGSTMSGPVAAFWSGVLSGRAAAGVFNQPPYDFTGKNIRPSDDLNAALSQQGKIKKQFNGLIGSKGDQYWELLDVDKKGVLTLGSSFSRNQGGAVQNADVLYYASGGFYVALTLYQLWPLEVDGKPSTLVWRGDIISSPELADLRGVERLGSESAMIKDVAKSVRALRSDSGGR